MMRALVFLSLVACGPSSTYYGDPAFSPDERAGIEAAARTMAERTGGDPLRIVWTRGDESDNRVLRAVPPSPDSDGEFKIAGDSYARTIYLRPGCDVRVVAAHEIGHSYGLDHHDEPGLMARVGRDAWTPADVRVCRSAGLCR